MNNVTDALKAIGWSEELIRAFFKDGEPEKESYSQSDFSNYADSNSLVVNSNSLVVDLSLNGNTTKLIFTLKKN